jgi:hypothetical protein
MTNTNTRRALAILAAISLSLSACGASRPAALPDEQQLIKAAGWEVDGHEILTQGSCQIITILIGKQTVEVYDGDEWVATNAAGTLGAKVYPGPENSCKQEVQRDLEGVSRG